MIVYYLHITSKYVKPEKWIFKSIDELDSFIESYKLNLPFLNEEMREEWYAIRESNFVNKEDLIYDSFSLVKIDTIKCPKWKRLFKAEMR